MIFRSTPPPDPDAHPDEKPAHRVRLPRYFIARYPVTVGQWRVYYDVVARGLWTPRRRDGRKCEPLDARSVTGVATHPVVYVSWYDAMDYGRWLTDQLRKSAAAEIRTSPGARTVPFALARLLLEGEATSGGRSWGVTLPSEAEWERSARGRRDAWPYPWRGAWDPNLANGWESGVDTTSAVGCFAGGASADRVEELSGNVGKWTRSLWGTDIVEPEFGYPYEPDSRSGSRENVRAGQDVLRVVRGGAFNSGSPRFLRSAVRDRDRPPGRYYDVGFRVGVSPFCS